MAVEDISKRQAPWIQMFWFIDEQIESRVCLWCIQDYVGKQWKSRTGIQIACLLEGHSFHHTAQSLFMNCCIVHLSYVVFVWHSSYKMSSLNLVNSPSEHLSLSDMIIPSMYTKGDICARLNDWP